MPSNPEPCLCGDPKCGRCYLGADEERRRERAEARAERRERERDRDREERGSWANRD